jgi:IS30 family transposase
VPNPDFNRILDGLPEKPPRSRLEQYRELILEMRRRGRTFREIALVLGEKCGVSVVASTVYDFVKAVESSAQQIERNMIRASRESRPAVQPDRGHSADSAEVKDRIAALKARKVPTATTTPRFRFVSGEPLRLPKSTNPRPTEK